MVYTFHCLPDYARYIPQVIALSTTAVFTPRRRGKLKGWQKVKKHR